MLLPPTLHCCTPLPFALHFLCLSSSLFPSDQQYIEQAFNELLEKLESDERVSRQVEQEFEALCTAYRNIRQRSQAEFGTKGISFNSLLHALVNLVDINEFNLSKRLTVFGLKVRRCPVPMVPVTSMSDITMAALC